MWSDGEDNIVNDEGSGGVEQEGDISDEIEYLGDFDDINLDILSDCQTDKGREKGEEKVTEEENEDYRREISEDDENGWSEEDEDRSEERVYDDFEVGPVGVESGSDDEDDDLGLDSDDGPPQQVNAPDEHEWSASRPFFMVGMTFEDKTELKRTVDNYAICLGVNLKVRKSDKNVFQVVCEDGCPFYLYASRYGVHVGFQIKTLNYEHSCARVYKNPRASAMWLADHFKDKVQEMPKYSSREMKDEVGRELKLNVTVQQCKRAKRKIMQEMEGSFKDEFLKLEAYCNELRISNPGSDVRVEVSPEALEVGRRVFRRMYLCFNASKVGWRDGCRPLIGLDGTFLKGKAKGILLTAVGIDANDSLFPLALGLVQKENGLLWTWFVECLRASLHLGNGEMITIMSDMQKVILLYLISYWFELSSFFSFSCILAAWVTASDCVMSMIT